MLSKSLLSVDGWNSQARYHPPPSSLRHHSPPQRKCLLSEQHPRSPLSLASPVKCRPRSLCFDHRSEDPVAGEVRRRSPRLSTERHHLSGSVTRTVPNSDTASFDQDPEKDGPYEEALRTRHSSFVVAVPRGRRSAASVLMEHP
ncbi:hypothetical protein CDAR_583021 [Caerostris darwini]|uniref:Uncharacterized protein n=1 Tax=Caerostris darwini TaxID=1538125 RepID=A0AAV4N4M6_9ARAC|nr:hypothetical protein CDAR_583021 [Caerostris darwini]